MSSNNSADKKLWEPRATINFPQSSGRENGDKTDKSIQLNISNEPDEVIENRKEWKVHEAVACALDKSLHMKISHHATFYDVCFKISLLLPICLISTLCSRALLTHYIRSV